MSVPPVLNSQIQNSANAVRTKGKRFSPNPAAGINSGRRSRDGDTVALSGSSSNGASGSNAAVASPATETADGSVAPSNSWSAIRKVITQMRQELQQQQLATVNASIAQAEASGANSTAAGSVSITVLAVQIESATEDGSTADAPAVSADPQSSTSALDPYWNADNTSDRIVNFAMQFAAAQGADPQGFSQTILDAVKAGFQEAHAATGDLPGAAGQLNQDTYDQTIKKLQDQLDAWQATLYNQPTTTPPEVATNAS